MIRETLNLKKRAVITSDRWHVVHARWSGVSERKPRFVRTIASEHEDRAKAFRALRALKLSLVAALAQRAEATRDQVFVRKPDFTTLKSTRMVVSR